MVTKPSPAPWKKRIMNRESSNKCTSVEFYRNPVQTTASACTVAPSMMMFLRPSVEAMLPAMIENRAPQMKYDENTSDIKVMFMPNAAA